LARAGDSTELHQLAARAEQMGQEYMLKLDDLEAEKNDRYAAAMMRDDLAPTVAPVVTQADIEAALTGNAPW
jgi:hypothetical protein